MDMHVEDVVNLRASHRNGCTSSDNDNKNTSFGAGIGPERSQPLLSAHYTAFYLRGIGGSRSFAEGFAPFSFHAQGPPAQMQNAIKSQKIQ
jgi:hypothetical protein